MCKKYFLLFLNIAKSNLPSTYLVIYLFCKESTTKENVTYLKQIKKKSFVLFFKDINTFIQQGHIKLVSSKSKGIYIAKKNCNTKCCSFELSVNQES